MWDMQFLHIPLSVLMANMLSCLKKKKGCVLMVGRDKSAERAIKCVNKIEEFVKERNKKYKEEEIIKFIECLIIEYNKN